MANNEVQVGHTIKVSGLATGLVGGSLLIHNGWPGVVVRDIIGTSEAFKTIEGREVEDGTLMGDGLGDMAVHGVYEFIDEGGDASEGDLVDRASASGVTKAAGVGALNAGHVWEAPFTKDGVRKVNVKLLGRPNA